MMKNTALLLLTFSLFASASPWQGTSGGFKVTIGPSDITAVDSSGKTVLSLKKFFDEQVKESCAPEADENYECQEDYTPVSLVGPYLSLRNFSSAYTGGAHPTAASTFITYDLRKPEKPISLVTWFDEKAVAGELAKDKVLKKYLKLKKSTPITMENLEKGFTPPDDCLFALGEYALSSFAFYSLEKNNKVAVRVGLSHSCEVARGSLTQFGILLPIPASLADDLKAAAEQKAGFLMKEAKKLFPKPIIFSWEAEKKKS